MEVIAEIANSHQGSVKTLKKLLTKLSKLNIKIIKFQIYFADELLTKSHKRFSHFKNQSFSEKEWINILEYSKKKKFKIYTDIFGLKAFKLANKMNVDGYKIHSSDLCNLKILQLLNKSKKMIFLSCGASNGFEISYALKKLKDANVTLMHGFQDYPTQLKDNNLYRLNWLKKNFDKKNIHLGFQDHTDGKNIAKSVLISTNAISLGSKYIEKHITLSRKLKIDSSSSLEPLEFKSYLNQLNDFALSLGKSEFDISSAEKNYRKIVKKFLVTNRFVKKNSVLNLKDVDFKRIDESYNINSSYIEDFIGKKTNKDILSEKVLRQVYLENKINALLIVRLKSKRLKKKSILKINGEYLIEHLIKRVKRLNGINKIILCTSTNKQDDKLANIANKNKIDLYRGDELNVLKRIYYCIKEFKCDHILRITGDDILTDKYYAEKTINTHLKHNSDYTDCKHIPSGTEIEVFSVKTIKNLYENLIDSSGSEYLTNYITENKDQFSISSCVVKNKHKSNIRLTIDTIEDFKNVELMFKFFYKHKKIYDYDIDDILNYYSLLKKKPKNSNIKQLKKPKKYNTKLSWSNFEN
jgi:N,N'-diacetyllegionaminate synthase